MSKEAKYINFKVLMDELKFFEENEDLPSRNDSRYIGNETIKVIIWHQKSCPKKSTWLFFRNH